MAFQRFDTLVAGDDVSGLVAANLLTYFHYKVIILRHTVAADRYLYKGFTLPISPYLLPPLDFGELMAQCKQYLSISQAEFERESELIERMQYITKRLRIDLPIDQSEFIDEFVYEIGMRKEIVKNLIKLASRRLEETISFFNSHVPYPPYSFWDKRRAASGISNRLYSGESVLISLPTERERLIFKTLLLFLQGYDTARLLPSQEALLSYLFLRNWFLLSSIEKFKSLLIKRLSDKGVLILDGTANKYYVEKKGFNYYVRDERLHNSYRVDSVIISADADSFRGFVSDKLWERLRLPKTDSFIRYTTNFVLPLRAIPPIAAKVIFINKGGRADDIITNSYQLTVSKVIRGKAIIKEHSLVSVTFFIRHSEYDKKNSEMLNRRAEEILLYVFPLVGESIISRSSVLDAESLLDVNLNEIKRESYLPSLAMYCNGDVKDFILISDMKTGINNFINVPSSIFAPLGVFGDFMAAIRGAEVISKSILGK